VKVITEIMKLNAMHRGHENMKIGVLPTRLIGKLGANNPNKKVLII